MGEADRHSQQCIAHAINYKIGSETRNILALRLGSNCVGASRASHRDRACPVAELSEECMGVVFEVGRRMEVAKEPIVDVRGAALVSVLFANVQHEALKG